jgi:hypothetical protein
LERILLSDSPAVSILSIKRQKPSERSENELQYYTPTLLSRSLERAFLRYRRSLLLVFAAPVDGVRFKPCIMHIAEFWVAQ